MCVWTLQSTGYIAHFSLMRVHFLYLNYSKIQLLLLPWNSTLQQVIAANYSVIDSLTYEKVKLQFFWPVLLFLISVRCTFLQYSHSIWPTENLPDYFCWPCSSLYDHNVPTFWWFLQVNKVQCRETQMTSNLFTEDESELTVLRWSSRSPNLSTIEHLWDVMDRWFTSGCVSDKSAETVWC